MSIIPKIAATNSEFIYFYSPAKEKIKKKSQKGKLVQERKRKRRGACLTTLKVINT